MMAEAVVSCPEREDQVEDVVENFKACIPWDMILSDLQEN